MEVEELAGSPTQWQPVSGRYGVEVWKVSGLHGEWVLKVGRNEGAAEVAREAAVWGRIAGMVPATSYGKRFQHGRGEGSAWLATPWLRGTSLWEAFYPVRERTGNHAEALAAAVQACMATASIHQAKWIHGDLQPHHIILMPDGARLIDWSWGWSPDGDLPASNAYNGALVHLASYELIGRAQSGQRPVLTSQPDEVWTLAASIWWAATNQWPRDYRSLAIDSAAFTQIELRKVILRNCPPLGCIGHWPQLEEVLRVVLDSPASARPGALDLAQSLRGITP
jgi:serine/threonine protein kinase